MEKSNKLKKVTILALLLSEIGCVSNEAGRYYLKEKLPTRKTREVEVLREAPQKAYVVIADFQARDATVAHMRKRAAQIGADAVIVVPVGGWYSEGEVWAQSDRYSNTYTRLIATAIKYKDFVPSIVEG